jgi:HAD superfamily phosphoserine phosphatase-like hydrolase
MRRVFVSSTVRDLTRHRTAVIDKIEQLGATVVAMEMFGARDARPKAECLRIIREETDVLVGIYAHRYGFIPPGDEISVTQQEYEQALVAKVPTFVYIVDRDYRWPSDQIETGTSGDKLAVFLETLKADRVVERFTTPSDLAASVAADLGRYFAGDATKSIVRHGLIHRPREDWVSGARKNTRPYKLVVFDFDGTLLRGSKFEFSWEAIWNSLGFAETQQKDLRREYRKRVGDGVPADERIAAYQDWCDKACAMFRARGLTRDQLRELTKPMHLTANCREAMTKLREAGIATAIVSGGVDTFLEDTFSDFRQYVDFAFINELAFSEDGTLEGVLATAYDFEGKTDALDLVCKRVGCARAEAVFVGDRFNDSDVLLEAGLGIAYPPNDYQAREAAQVIVDKDDLLAILPHILGN